MIRRVLKFVLGGMVALVIAIIVFAPDNDGTATGSAAEQAPVPVTSRALFDAYDANEAAGHARFGDKRLAVSGKVTAIDLDLTNDAVVKLETANRYIDVLARLDDASQGKAIALRKGQTITLVCERVSEVGGTPVLSSCAL